MKMNNCQKSGYKIPLQEKEILEGFSKVINGLKNY